MERYSNSLLVCIWTTFFNCIFNQYIFRQYKNICFGDVCIGTASHVFLLVCFLLFNYDFCLWLLVRFIKNDLVKWISCVIGCLYIILGMCALYSHRLCSKYNGKVFRIFSYDCNGISMFKKKMV